MELQKHDSKALKVLNISQGTKPAVFFEKLKITSKNPDQPKTTKAVCMHLGSWAISFLVLHIFVSTVNLVNMPKLNLLNICLLISRGFFSSNNSFQG